MSQELKAQTQIVIGEVRFSYAHVFKPTAMEEGQDKKYSVSIVIPKSDKKTIAKINKAYEAARELGKTEKWNGKIPSSVKSPLRDGDEERPDDEAYEGMLFLTANGKSKPGILDRFKKEITDEEEFYSGCHGHASITLYPFAVTGNKGVAVGLNNLMKTREGERLAGRNTAERDFADIEVADEGDDLL